MPTQAWKLAEFLATLFVGAVLLLLLTLLGNPASIAQPTLTQSFWQWLAFVQRPEIIKTAACMAVAAATRDWWWPFRTLSGK